MIIQSVEQLSFDFLAGRSIVVVPVEADLTSDAGLLPIRQLDAKLGLTEQFAQALFDRRCPEQVRHSVAEMARARIFGILAGYEDQNDHDALRSDPVFKLIAGRSPDDCPLASQPTLSRFENSIDIASLRRLQDVLIEQFIASFDRPPRRVTLDIDTFDDPTHGQQQLTFFHGYYDQYQYQPRLITCAENDLVVMLCLLHGSARPVLGAEDDLEFLVARLRAAWPGVRIELRGDSGFGVPTMYDACERLDVQYTFGLGMNPALKNRSDELLAWATQQFEATGLPQRHFCAGWYKAESWPAQRWVVIKVEVHQQGPNRRAVVTNRPGAFVSPRAAYDEYAERGESENRNKEIKRGLDADRLSDHRYLANLFRLYLHAAALNLLVHVRRLAADPPPNPGPLPAEALAHPERSQYHNRRRERDPLGEGQPCTWRTRLIKVAARVKVSARRVLVELSGCWPYLHHYQHVSRCVLAFHRGPASAPG